jgi:hypothetical protein
VSEVVCTLGWNELEEAAQRLAELLPAPRPGRSPVMVSLDFDFFSGPSRPAASDPPGVRDQRREYFGWQGDESMDADESLRWWREQASRATGRGVALDSVFGAHGLPDVKSASKALEAVGRAAGGSVIAESHVWGAVYARALVIQSGRAVELVSIDRHHDLGYINPEQLDARAARAYLDEGASCDNWLWGAIDRGWIASCTLVKADGIWYDEYVTEPPQAPVSVLEQVSRARWSEITLPRYADALLLVRSGPWSPPWLDADFQKLAHRLAPAGMWVDERDDLPRIGALSARQIRPWP